MTPPDDLAQIISAGMGTVAAKIQRASEVLIKRLQATDAEIARLTKQVQALQRKVDRYVPKDE